MSIPPDSAITPSVILISTHCPELAPSRVASCALSSGWLLKLINNSCQELSVTRWMFWVERDLSATLSRRVALATEEGENEERSNFRKADLIGLPSISSSLSAP